ncbi:hypothetical protein [Burkholderia ubonensis]|uniref:hypothetical protein n=1 Tax=Burkholderia ubonensis TaxID=101571 RepID=UPI0012FC5EE4|nr:hypothetical protein [Burkholderia ubonensis]
MDRAIDIRTNAMARTRKGDVPCSANGVAKIETESGSPVVMSSGQLKFLILSAIYGVKISLQFWHFRQYFPGQIEGGYLASLLRRPLPRRFVDVQHTDCKHLSFNFDFLKSLDAMALHKNQFLSLQLIRLTSRNFRNISFPNEQDDAWDHLAE